MERPENIVLDASVVVKWFVDEEYTDSSLQLLEDYLNGKVTLYSVQLMPYEVINALRYNSIIGRSDLVQIGRALARFQIVLYPLLDGLCENAISIAIDSGTTVYDAAYLALAISMKSPLYTSDQKFMDKIGDHYPAYHISNYK
ncbi:MAG: type II toxin-antitoxin system VapC family toxin [Thermoplasmataceae archaeon]